MKQPDREYLTKLCGEVVAFEPVVYHGGKNYDWRWGFVNTNPIGDIRIARSELLRREGVWADMLVMSLGLWDAFCANESVNEYRRGRPGPICVSHIVQEQTQIAYGTVDHEWEGEPYCYVVATASGR